MTIELFRGDGRHPWYLRLVARNGKIMLVSEGYATRWNARRAARKLSRRFRGIEVVER